ncbi:MAG: UDP-N-acetylmuramate--L-alanine ligase [Gammaproteobacteria bacterium]|nr:UDP-N-acetylmuramate--L-alanine ligase [Gammaproteobacteria bacterium]
MREFIDHIHFIGIGGIGMSGIAEVLLDLNYTISGSDVAESPVLDRLRKAGATIYLGHRVAHIEGAHAVVTSSAIDDDNCEVIAAQEKKIPLLPRAAMLGELMRFRKGIAITGTHGKTTTTSLIASILATAGADPTFIVGGVVNSLHSNARLGQGEYMVAEADESDASFLHLQPLMAVVTNIDQDHMETYGGSFDNLKQTYLTFLGNLPFYGLAILCFDDPNIREISLKLHKSFISYGFSEEVDYRATDLVQKGTKSYFSLSRHGEPAGEFMLSIPGRHNVLNALAALSIAFTLGLPVEAMRQSLSGFQGISRRFDQLGTVRIGGHRVELVDDYAHHPTELAATLQAAGDCWPDRRFVVVFQPHRYTRTRDLFDDFAQVLAGVDHLVVTEVYPAGENMIAGADGRSLCRAIRKRGSDPVFVPSLGELKSVLPCLVQDGDILLTLGAGDIGRFAQYLSMKAAMPAEAVNDG